MRVVARDVEWGECPVEIAPYATKSQTFITKLRVYEVHAVTVFSGLPSVLIVNDIGYPTWEKSWLFDVVDSSIPGDWICNLLHNEPVVVLGPEFLAKDAEAYRAMVELEADQVDLFWKRIEAIQAEEQEQ